MNNRITAIFDAWIIRQHNRLKQRIIHIGLFDEDAFQETYLMMRNTLTDNDYNKDFETLFITLYKQALSREYSREMRFFHPNPLFFIFLHSGDTEPGCEEEHPLPEDIQSKQVDDYVRYNFKTEDYLIFHLKFFEAMTWQGLTEYTGQSSATISRKLNNIKDGVRQHFNHIGIRRSMATF